MVSVYSYSENAIVQACPRSAFRPFAGAAEDMRTTSSGWSQCKRAVCFPPQLAGFDRIHYLLGGKGGDTPIPGLVVAIAEKKGGIPSVLRCSQFADCLYTLSSGFGGIAPFRLLHILHISKQGTPVVKAIASVYVIS